MSNDAKPKKAPKKWRWICSKCGSDKVQLAMWVKPNTGEIGEPVFDEIMPAITVFWCDNCDEEHELKRVPA